jgi:hypothetical protein
LSALFRYQSQVIATYARAARRLDTEVKTFVTHPSPA